jgi:hypothetical protein
MFLNKLLILIKMHSIEMRHQVLRGANDTQAGLRATRRQRRPPSFADASPVAPAWPGGFEGTRNRRARAPTSL